MLIREDGTFLYTLPSVVDDIDFGITHIIRGEDHVTNTAAQIEIFAALGRPDAAPSPISRCWSAAGGEALSKRLGSLSLASCARRGSSRWRSPPISPRSAPPMRSSCAALDELAAEFDFAKIGRAPAHFDQAELAGLNARLLHAHGLTRPWPTGWRRWASAAAPVLGGGAGQSEQACRRRRLWRLVEGPLTPVIEDAALWPRPPRVCRPKALGRGHLAAWTKAVRRRHRGQKGRALSIPLRLALTGQEHGPELKKLLPLIGRARSLRGFRDNRPDGLYRVFDPMRHFGCHIVRISICG